MEDRCDQIIQCKDKSDEDNCKLVVFEKSYNKKIPPFTTNMTRIVPVMVNVSTILKNVLKIEESHHTIDLKIGISLQWKETTRVQYHNLKQEEALNILDNDEVEKLWIPYIIFENTDDDEAVKLDAITVDGNIRTLVSVYRSEGVTFTRSGPEVSDEVVNSQRFCMET